MLVKNASKKVVSLSNQAGSHGNASFFLGSVVLPSEYQVMIEVETPTMSQSWKPVTL
jgi:hypothetical protein